LGYVIAYDMKEKKYEIRRNRSCRFSFLLTAAFCLFVVGTLYFWPEGREILISMVIPGEDSVTIAAFRNMTGNLRAGAAVGDAIAAFCADVIQAGHAAG